MKILVTLLAVVLLSVSCSSVEQQLLNSQLRFASWRGDLSTVKFLLENGADVNAKDKEGRTALMGAYALYHVETVKLLLKNGADANAKDEKGSTVLFSAAFSKRQEASILAKLLLENGADANAKDENGRTALFIAIYGRVETVKLLLENGVDVNTKDEKGKTALFYADSKRMKALLIKHGAK